MSVIGKKPFVNYIVDECSPEQVELIISLLDNLGAPAYVSFKTLNNSFLGVHYVVFNLDELQNKNVEGILVYIDATHCGLFSFTSVSGNMSEFKLNLSSKSSVQIYEHLTVEELRQVCGDAIGGGGGVTLDYATNEEIDALFDDTPVVQMATITFDYLTFCHLEINGVEIDSGYQVPIGQPLEIAVVGDYLEYEWNCTILTMNGQDIRNLFDDSGNPASITIPSVTGDIYAEIECVDAEEPVEARIYFEDPATGEEITDLSMAQGETTNIYDYIQFENIITDVTLSCDNPNVINLTVAGVMEAIGSVGEGATITVTSVSDPTISAELYVEIVDEEPITEIAVSFYSDSLNSTGLNWDGQTMEPGDEIDVSFTVNNLVSNSRFIDLEDITPDFSVEVTNDGNEDTGATITRTGSGMNTQWRVQTIAQGDVEVIVNYNPVTFNDDVFSGEHRLYTNMTQVDFANLGSASIASSFSLDSLWDSYDTGLSVNTYAIPLYSPDGLYNQVLQSEITANPAQHKGFWLYIDATSHNPVVCCVHGTEGAVASMNDFESFNVLDQQSGQSLDCITYFHGENFNGNINVAFFFFEDLREEISGSGQCFLFYDKSGSY